MIPAIESENLQGDHGIEWRHANLAGNIGIKGAQGMILQPLHDPWQMIAHYIPVIGRIGNGGEEAAGAEYVKGDKESGTRPCLVTVSGRKKKKEKEQR